MWKIVHFGKYYSPEAGGIETVTSSLAQGAARAGHQVVVVCFNKTPIVNISNMAGVRVIRLPIATVIASQPLGWKYFNFCLSAAREADVVHMHAPNMLGAVCALFISRNSRLVVHWHSDVLEKGIFGAMVRPLELALLKRADCIIATSARYVSASPTLRKYKSKIAIVPIGVPDRCSEFHRRGKRAPLSADLESKISGKKILLAVGRLVPYKGFHILIEAAKHLRDEAVVVIVGGGPLHESLQSAIDAAGLVGRVFLLGRLPDECLRELLARASIYCLPSIYRAEAFGVVLLEAMAYGLPIIASNIPGSGVPWVNKHGVSGINVPVGDATALACACNRLLASDTERIRLSEGARRRYVTKFTEDKSVAQVMATYRRLLSH